ncbi:MAG: MFS transporter [Clostridia bacterium]|nr:MFS transporter [Clostridia bacterium]
MIKIKPNVRNAILLGGMCSISYLAVYFARNILGTVSPQMIESGAFTTGQIGTLSSVYFITYAFGQLINGAIGDKVKAKYMISFGLALAGICNFCLTVTTGSPMAAYIAYGLTGFFLSMIYGPMVKVVSENTEPLYATRCSMGYTFASFIGSPMAGVFAMFFAWQGVFVSSSVVLVVMGILCFLAFSILERKKIVEYNKFQKTKEQGGGIKVLIQRQIIKFTLISIVTGVVRTSVVFWLPTYLSQRLGFPSENAALIFTIATLVISFTTFFAIFLYERLHYNMDLTILVVFISAVICFIFVYFLRQPIGNILFMVLGIMSSNAAATMLWSRYCPSLRDTGMVSVATGFLDFVSYMAASASSAIFANAVAGIGWDGLVLVWVALMVVGVIIALPYNKFKKAVRAL